MGPGKTLQILIFLAWLIEQEEKWAALPPWKPILIVALLILVDDDGPWPTDMRTYFKGDGAPRCLPTGSTLSGVCFGQRGRRRGLPDDGFDLGSILVFTRVRRGSRTFVRAADLGL
jgi:hypothetical protein